MSYYRIAERAQLSASTVQSLMSGKTKPCVYTLFKLCNALEVSMDEILKNNGDLDEWNEKRIVRENLEEQYSLNLEEKKIVFLYRCLSQKKREMLKEYMDMLEWYIKKSDEENENN